jgi:tRNA(fMet)-specific endonuclease VapC
VKALLADTNIISYAYNQHSLWKLYAPVLEGNQILIAAQTVAEMRFGSMLKNWGENKRQRLELLLTQYVVVHTDDEICSEWARIQNESYKKGRPISINDAWIAATAKSLGIPLVTHNHKDFEFISDLTLVSEAS